MAFHREHAFSGFPYSTALLSASLSPQTASLGSLTWIYPVSPPAGCFPCCLSLRGAAPRIFGKWDIHTRGSHGGDPPHLGVILAGAGGGGNIIGFGLWLPFAWQSSDDAGAKAAFEHLHPCGCLGTAGVLVQIWAVLASAGWWQQSCLPLPLPFGGWPSLPLPKVVPGGAAPCRGVRANSATQEPPPALPLFRGSGSGPSIWCFLPVPTVSRCSSHRWEQIWGGGGGWGAYLPALLPVCAKDFFLKFWTQGHICFSGLFTPEQQFRPARRLRSCNSSASWNQPAFLAVCESFFFVMQLCPICITMTICIGINSGSVLDAWFVLGRPYSCLTLFLFFSFFNIYSKENYFTFGDPKNDLTCGNMCSGGNNLTTFTYLAS